jgi:mutator protein MutT
MALTAAVSARPVLGVSAAIFRDGRVLLAQRAPGRSLAGLWSLPGGHVEAGERLAEAAAREVREEVGLDVAIGPLAGYVELVGGPHFVILAFVARWQGGEPVANEEVSGLRWADPATLDGLPVTPGLAAIIRDAAQLADDAA